MWGANEQRAWQSVLRIPGPDVVDVTPLWSRVDATCTGESLHIVIRPKVQKEYKGGDWQFPHFLSFPSKGSSHADLGWNAFPATCCQSLNKELKFRSGTRDF